MAERIIIESVKDAVAIGSSLVESAKSEITFLLPPEMLVFADQFGITNKCKTLIEHGGRVRGITKVTNIYRNVVQELIDIGEEVRHVDHYQGTFLLVGDNKESISSIYLDLEELSLDDEPKAFWTDSQAYADYLMATFDFEWERAADMKKTLKEL